MSSRVVLLVAPLTLLAACGSSSSSSKSTTAAPPTTGVTTTATTTQRPRNNLAIQRVPGIGAVLTSGTGQALYVYTPEKGGKVKCVGGCASLWPPLMLLVGTKPEISSAVHPNLVGTVTDPAGGRIITYAGWPLHTYASDASHGTYRGQGADGQWYLISPSGPVITKPVNTGSSGY
jgi:predicted lipoprotein with Yx(FWY)xxD motif